MGIKYCEKKNYYIVSYSRRHPMTKESRGLRRIGIKSKREAEKVYKELIIKIADKFNDDINPYWEEVIENFLKSFKEIGVMNSTYVNYSSSLRAHTVPFWKNKRMKDFSTFDIKILLDSLSSYSESHRKNMLKYIRAVFNYAIEQRYISFNPSPKIKFKIRNKIKPVLNESQVKLLLREGKNREHPWFPIWALALFTGMRSGELYALTWDKVDFDRGVLFVTTSWTKKDGFKETKTGNDRVVEIASNLVPVINDLYINRVDEFILPRIHEWTTGCQAKVLKDFLKEINLPLIRFHDLRASWATIMLNKGVEPIKVMSMGGWRDLKTMQIYIRKAGVDINGITDQLIFL